MLYSDAFILSQIKYYRDRARSGSSRDWNLIAGIRNRYEQEARRRGLAIPSQ